MTVIPVFLLLKPTIRCVARSDSRRRGQASAPPGAGAFPASPPRYRHKTSVSA